MRFAQIISDGAVFQRWMPIPVWGWCTPFAKVKVDFAGQKLATAANRMGYFELRIPPMKEGGPYKLIALDCLTGEKCTVVDILVGDVWLASGQSNMQFRLKASGPDDKLAQTQQYLDEGGIDDSIRMITVGRPTVGMPEDDMDGQWEKSNADTAPEFSAVGAWFALRLRKELGVPIGIINSSYGGTAVHSWMSREAMMRLDCTRNVVVASEGMVYQREKWDMLPDDVSKAIVSRAPMDFSKIAHRDLGNSGFAAGLASKDYDDSDWRTMQVPGSWRVQQIGGNGAIWLRCTIGIPLAMENQELELHLGGVDKHDVTYFNGVQIGATGKDLESEFWDKPRCYRVPAELVKGGKAVIAIRAFSFFFDGSLNGKAEDYWLGRKGDAMRVALPGIWKARMEYEFPTIPGSRVFGNPLSVQFTSPERVHNPHFLFDTMVRPLLPYAIRGAIWYQGETDSNEYQCRDYEEKLGAMIDDWRYRWGQGDFPFYIVQLANYGTSKAEEWLTVQDAQRRVARKCRNAGVIPGTDIGEENDIHPHDKRSFGLRLANLALHDTYGNEGVTPTGPMLKDVFSQGGNELRLVFDWGHGLRNASGSDDELSGFEVANWSGKEFHTAKARIEGDAVIVHSDKVSCPRHVRYNWNCCPRTHIVNDAGLPMLTFNTCK